MILHIVKLLCLLIVIAIVVAAWILLCPIKYQGNIDISEKKGNLYIFYLHRMIRFRLSVDDGVHVVLYLLFKKFDFTDPEYKRRQQLKKQKKMAKKKAKMLRKKERERRKWMRKHGREENNRQQDQEMFHSDTAQSSPSEASQRESKLDGLKRNLPKIKIIWNSIRETELISLLMPKILKLLGRIAPKKISGEIAFGFEDPSVTGKTVGVIAMVPFLYTTELRIYPDFECEEKYCNGKVSLAGQLRIIHLVLFVVSCLKEKRVRKFIKLIRVKDKSQKK